MCKLVEIALERAEESLNRISGTCQLRKTGNPSIFCSSLPNHWRYKIRLFLNIFSSYYIVKFLIKKCLDRINPYQLHSLY